MKIYRPFVTLLFLTFAVLLLPAQNVGIIPSPQQVEFRAGSFMWYHPRVAFPSDFAKADFFVEQLKELPEAEAALSDDATNAEIVFELSENLNFTLFHSCWYPALCLAT